MSAIVTLMPYDPAWPAQFVLIRNMLAAALEDAAVTIEHVGSTSVPGFAAKPVIDVDVVIRPGAFPDVRSRLEAAGYRHAGDQGIAGREVFKCAAALQPFYEKFGFFTMLCGQREMRPGRD